MRHRPLSKVQVLNVRHPGLREKLDAMFEEFWTAGEVRQLLHAHYGERLSLSYLEKYRAKHWRARRALAAQASGALAEAQVFALAVNATGKGACATVAPPLLAVLQKSIVGSYRKMENVQMPAGSRRYDAGRAVAAATALQV
jgi:hypothetical protein